MTKRAILRLALVGASLGPLVGCSLYGLAGAWNGFGATTSAVSTVANERTVYVSGQIRIPEGITSGKTLADLPNLSNLSPLLGVAGMAGVFQYGTAALGRGIQATELANSSVKEASIQFVDCLTGEVVATATSDAGGRYSIQLVFSGTQRAYMAQVILRNRNLQVAGFLAAPLGVNLASPEGKRAGVDLTPSSTMVAYSATLLSEIYPSVNLAQGFVGLTSTRLAAMVMAVAPGPLQNAGIWMDRESRFSSAPSFENLLSTVATSSAVLTSKVKMVSAQVLATDSMLVESPGINAAVLSQMVERIGALKVAPTEAGDLLSAIAAQVDLGRARQDAMPISKALPSLPPLPTPTPAEGANVTLN